MPQRLTQQRLSEAQAQKVEPFPVPLDSPWKVNFELQAQDGLLTMNAGPGAPGLPLDLELDTRKYNVLRVTMRADAGRACRLNWVSAVENEFPKNPGASVPIFPDNEFHTYTIPLQNSELTWNGLTSGILFFPSFQVPANVEVKEVVFDYEPPAAPVRLNLIQGENLTCEALFGTQQPWVVQVPEHGILETHVGITRRGWELYKSDGARFIIMAETGIGERMTLIDRTLQPGLNEADRGWVRLSRDLSAHAGQELTLSLVVDGLGGRTGDYAFWGNPMVYSGATKPESKPVFLISLDTVRASYLSAYGYEQDTTPFLTQWAQDCAVFENAIVQDAWTLPSHTTMLTGLYPKHHGVTPQVNMAEQVATLPELLREAGYLTAGHTSISWWLEQYHGFGQGFDMYGTPSPYRNGFITNRRVFEWLADHPVNNVFVFMHNYDAHSKSSSMGFKLPYRSEWERFKSFSLAHLPAPELKRPDMGDLFASDFLVAANQKRLTIEQHELEYIKSLYYDALLSVDGAMREFVEELQARGMYENAMVILTSDHGEAFGEHGNYMHEDCYETCARVPLFIKFPAQEYAGKRFDGVVELVDLLPTVLEVLGRPAHEAADGQSLVGVLEGRVQPREFTYTRRHNVDAVRRGDWKLMRDAASGSFELYDLASDPMEQENRVESHPDEFALLKGELEQFYAPPAGGWHVRFEAGAAPVTFKANFSTDDRITGIPLIQNSSGREYEPKLDDREKNLDITLPLGAGEVVELNLRTAGARALFTATVEADIEFSVLPADAETPPAAQQRLLLNPETPHGPPSEEAGSSSPRMSVWFVQPVVQGTAAQELTPEQINELEALGYIQ